MTDCIVVFDINQFYLGANDALRVLFKAGADPMHVDKDSLSGTTTTLWKYH